MVDFMDEIIPPEQNGRESEKAVRRWRIVISAMVAGLWLAVSGLFGFVTGTLPNWDGYLSKNEFQSTKYEVDTMYSFYLQTRIDNARVLQCRAVVDANPQSMFTSYQVLQRWVNEFYRHEGYAYSIPSCAELLPHTPGPQITITPVAPIPVPQVPTAK